MKRHYNRKEILEAFQFARQNGWKVKENPLPNGNYEFILKITGTVFAPVLEITEERVGE